MAQQYGRNLIQSRFMDLLQIAKKERAKLDRVIALLEDKDGMASVLGGTKAQQADGPKPKGRKWTAAMREAMSKRQKALWAKKRKAR